MDEARSQKRRRRVKRVGAALLVVYLMVISCGQPADRMILFPPKGHIDAGPAAHRVVIRPQGRDLEIWTARSPALAPDDEPQAYVLEFTGNATRAEQIARYVADRWKNHPVEAWVMNYPGYGGSEGGAHF